MIEEINILKDTLAKVSEEKEALLLQVKKVIRMRTKASKNLRNNITVINVNLLENLKKFL
jgi:hypothetical protein